MEGAMPRARKLLIWLLGAVVLVGCLPGAAGYAWAIAWLPVYGAVCHPDKVFGSSIGRDGYRIFLLGRGCDVNATIRQIVTASGLDVDPAKIIAIYNGAQRPETADEYLAIDKVRSGLTEFAGAAPRDNECTPDGYCKIPASSDEGFVARFAGAYLSYARSQFRFTTEDGADYITSLLRMGRIAQGILLLCYLAIALVLGKRIVDAATSLLRTR